MTDPVPPPDRSRTDAAGAAADAFPVPLADPASDPTAHEALIDWRRGHLQRLAGPTGWWALAGLEWLGAEPATVGSDPASTVRLPASAPDRVATLHPDAEGVSVHPDAACGPYLDGLKVRRPVRVSRADRTFTLSSERDAIRFTVLVRAARRGVRWTDPARAKARDPQREVAWYPLQPGWVLPARFEAADADAVVQVVDQLGDVRRSPAAGQLHFRMHGEPYALLATWSGDDLFVALRDAGSGTASYGAGRYLRVPAPEEGVTVLTFHRLHHPPCAHSPFATCPLPPLSNRLPFEVRAGERLFDETLPPSTA